MMDHDASDSIYERFERSPTIKHATTDPKIQKKRHSWNPTYDNVKVSHSTDSGIQVCRSESELSEVFSVGLEPLPTPPPPPRRDKPTEDGQKTQRSVGSDGVSIFIEDTEDKSESETLVESRGVSTQTESVPPAERKKSKWKIGKREVPGIRLSGTVSKEDERSFSWMKKQFQQMAGPDGTLDKEAFRKALQTKKSFFTDRLFELFDNNKSGSLDVVELLHGIYRLTKGTPTEKLRFLFRIYDADSSGTIDREELATVLRSCMEESNLNLSEENLEALTDALFEDADKDKSGFITFEELKDQLERHPDIMANLTISTAQWMMPPKKPKTSVMPRKLTWTYIRNNLMKVTFITFYFIINIGLFLLNGWLYWDTNWYIRVARGAGMCLNFNCAFVLVLMLRKTLTLLRNTPLVKILPFDHSVMFHKVAGFAIVFFTLAHTAAHLANAAIYLTKDLNMPLWEILFTLESYVGWFYGFAFLSGVILDVILLVMFVCSMEFVRRSGYFEIFYWTHKLYIPFYILNILHGANFWKWIVGPGAIFVIELMLKLKWTQRGGSMHITKVHLLPSGVTQLTISRPTGFSYKPGDYIFLNIPVIAKYEWHPFTISSAPEMPDSITLHIRSAGHWTKLLYSYFETLLLLAPTPDEIEKGEIYQKVRAKWRQTSTKNNIYFEHRRRNTKARKINASTKRRVKQLKVNVPVNVDGPYGTPTRHIFDAEHAVLIGSGIGVTPFASILQSIMHKLHAAEIGCPKCYHRFCVDVPKSVMNLKKVDFVWINRDQRHFEWFLSLLTRLEREQARDTGLDRRLDMHMYMTSAVSKSDMKGIGLQMALDLIHDSEQTDLITGLQTRTQPGRPDFDQLFSQISEKAKGKVKVFFCGSPLLARTVKHYCLKYKFSFSQETF